MACAAETGDGEAPRADASKSDALAERLAKARAYKAQREKDSLGLDSSAELRSVVTEAVQRLEEGKEAEKKKADEPTPPQENAVRVRIMVGSGRPPARASSGQSLLRDCPPKGKMRQSSSVSALLTARRRRRLRCD